MSELTKIIFTINIVVLFIQLGLSIVYNWDEESRNNQKLKKYVKIFGAFTLGTIGLSFLVLILKVIWID